LTHSLSELGIKSLPVKDKSYKVYDGEGLYLEVYPGGSKLWRYRWKEGGKDIRVSLGPWPMVGLKKAREMAAARRLGRVTGEAPPTSKTLSDLYEEWKARFYPKLAASTVKKREIHYKKYILPCLGDIEITELTPSVILNSLLRPIENAGHLETAHTLKMVLSQVLRYAVASGYIERDNTQDLRGAIPPPSVKHRATVIDPERIGILIRDIHNYTGSFIVRYALRILPYVFVRPGELRHAEWEDFKFDESIWRIPPEKMKMRLPHLVPLSSQVKRLFLELREYSNGTGYVFPGARRTGRPISDMAINAALRYLGYGRDEIVGHGFRAMASTILNEKGYKPDWIERQLAHSEKNAIRAAYNHAEYWPERVKMMQDWADYLDSLMID
jgi:integrase